MKKLFKFTGIAFTAALVISEMTLRWLGFHDFPTYREDNQYEYIHHSNQKRKIYRNDFFTNHYGMRSAEVDTAKKSVLLIGDSVLNGGNRNSNKDLASSIIGNYLPDSLQSLNISSGSWGPDNGMEFIKTHGDFNASLVVLIFNSHDAGDFMSFSPQVGINPTKPAKNDQIAIIAFFKRFLLPKINKPVYVSEISKTTTGNFTELNPGWDYFFKYCKSKNIPLIVFLHSEKTESKIGRYDEEGQKIIAFCRENNIVIVEDINEIAPEYYSDEIHLNPKGQKMIADLLRPVILKSLNNN